MSLTVRSGKFATAVISDSLLRKPMAACWCRMVKSLGLNCDCGDRAGAPSGLVLDIEMSSKSVRSQRNARYWAKNGAKDAVRRRRNRNTKRTESCRKLQESTGLRQTNDRNRTNMYQSSLCVCSSADKVADSLAAFNITLQCLR